MLITCIKCRFIYRKHDPWRFLYIPEHILVSVFRMGVKLKTMGTVRISCSHERRCRNKGDEMPCKENSWELPLKASFKRRKTMLPEGIFTPKSSSWTIEMPIRNIIPSESTSKIVLHFCILFLLTRNSIFNFCTLNVIR